MDTPAPALVMFFFALVLGLGFIATLVLSEGAEIPSIELSGDPERLDADPTSIVVFDDTPEERGDEERGVRESDFFEITEKVSDFDLDRGHLKDKVDSQGYLLHVGESGDTLAKLAERYLGRKALWQALKEHNPDVLDGAGRVKVGVTVKIPIWLRGR